MVEELLKLKDMLDKGIITKEEFAAAKEELAFKNRTVPLQRKPVSKSGFAPNSRPMHAPPKSSPKVQCPKCGEDMPTSRNYCDLCGAKLPENIQQSACEKDKGNKSSVFIRAIIGVAAVFAFVSLAIIPLIEKVSESQNEKKAIVETCEKYGLDNVSVDYQIDTHKKTACINSTNFDSLSYSEMMNLQADLPNSFEYTYKHQNSVFRINLMENTIYENDSVIYHKETLDSKPQPQKDEKAEPASTYSTYISDKEKEELYYVAKSFVKNHLLSPSKAKFALYYECDYKRGTGNVYNVVGWVESQNIYGAITRETWSCMMERNGDRISLVMLDIGGNLYFD